MRGHVLALTYAISGSMNMAPPDQFIQRSRPQFVYTVKACVTPRYTDLGGPRSPLTLVGVNFPAQNVSELLRKPKLTPSVIHRLRLETATRIALSPAGVDALSRQNFVILHGRAASALPCHLGHTHELVTEVQAVRGAVPDVQTDAGSRRVIDVTLREAADHLYWFCGFLVGVF